MSDLDPTLIRLANNIVNTIKMQEKVREEIGGMFFNNTVDDVAYMIKMYMEWKEEQGDNDE